jgi:cytochrome c-type biogenesis protein CcmH/NrfF
VFLIVLVGMFVAMRRRRKRKKAEKLARQENERIARDGAQDGNTLDLYRLP